jgi:hypothetical protein
VWIYVNGKKQRKSLGAKVAKRDQNVQSCFDFSTSSVGQVTWPMAFFQGLPHFVLCQWESESGVNYHLQTSFGPVLLIGALTKAWFVSCYTLSPEFAAGSAIEGSPERPTD